MTHIFIATPMYGGQCFGPYAQSLLGLQGVMAQMKITTTLSFMFNESLITRARNALTHNFLKTECTHLLFIDADIRFDPTQVPAMITADKDIICGVYPKKEINWPMVRRAIEQGAKDDDLKYHTGSWVVNLANYAAEVTVPIHQPAEVWQGGTGFMLIKREVFTIMKPHCHIYANDTVDTSGNIKTGDEIIEYFATSIEPGTRRLLSEDYHFCYNWRVKCNGKIHIAPWVNLAHMGTYFFEGRLMENKP